MEVTSVFLFAIRRSFLSRARGRQRMGKEKGKKDRLITVIFHLETIKWCSRLQSPAAVHFNVQKRWFSLVLKIPTGLLNNVDWYSWIIVSRNLPNTFENDCSFRIVCSSLIIKGFPGSVEEDHFSGSIKAGKGICCSWCTGQPWKSIAIYEALWVADRCVCGGRYCMFIPSLNFKCSCFVFWRVGHVLVGI